METSKLNLTRKWRSKTFDTIVGQDLSIRILKNSLYLDQLFPVYLFSGQRGCGKTTTARVFTAALNCHNLAKFRQDPKSHPVPCQQCDSCLAMSLGKHPDFIEIDAASHTGVDHVRQLIETTTFLPILGSKKIYLIDEVHMLSKAAFNALLKIMEEPPQGVVFILATTDPHKVLDTVKSRCFQLFFGPPPVQVLLKHLQDVCAQEGILAEAEALEILIREADGSIRDAMNLLEQVRFIGSQVTVGTVSRALGYIGDQQILNLIDLTLERSSQIAQHLSQINLADKNIEFVWQRVGELLKQLIYRKQGVVVSIPTSLEEQLSQIAAKFSIREMISFLSSFVGYEQVLLKTTHKALALELFFLQRVGSEEQTYMPSGEGRAELVESEELQDGPTSPASFSNTGSSDLWQQFLGLLSQVPDPILNSVFSRVKFQQVDQAELVHLELEERYAFLSELITEKQAAWTGYLKQVFGSEAKIKINLVADQELAQAPLDAQLGSVGGSSSSLTKSFTKTGVDIRLTGESKQFDVSDKNKWPLANQILEQFPGQVYEVKGD